MSTQTELSVIAPVSGTPSTRARLLQQFVDAESIKRFSTPNGMVFSLWVAFHLGIWAAGFLAIILLRGHWGWQTIVAVLLGSQIHTLTILQHDCGHGSAYQSDAANRWVGRFLAWFIYMPFTTFTELHRWHHAYLGNAHKDPDEWFYQGGPGWMFLRECLFMPRFIWLSLTRDDISPENKRSVGCELVFNTLSLLGLSLLLLAADRMDILVFAFLLPMALLAMVFNPISRGFEHYPLACMRRDDPRRLDLQHNTVSVTSPWVGFIWANITLHIEHHVYPRVPFYRLRKLSTHLTHIGLHHVPLPLVDMKRLKSMYAAPVGPSAQPTRLIAESPRPHGQAIHIMNE